MTNVDQYCTFTLDGTLFGMEVGRVQEVLRGQAVTPVPLAPPSVVGLINLRGQVVTVVDLRRLLDLGPPGDGASPLHMIVRTLDGPVSLLVDHIGEVIHVDPASFEEAPPTVEGTAGDLITGAFKEKRRLILVLDLDRALEADRPSERRDDSRTRS